MRRAHARRRYESGRGSPQGPRRASRLAAVVFATAGEPAPILSTAAQFPRATLHAVPLHLPSPSPVRPRALDRVFNCCLLLLLLPLLLPCAAALCLPALLLERPPATAASRLPVGAELAVKPSSPSPHPVAAPSRPPPPTVRPAAPPAQWPPRCVPLSCLGLAAAADWTSSSESTSSW